ncbi:hypothetical protein ACFVDH_31375, partial [Streptomyces sp. NPDC057674]
RSGTATPPRLRSGVRTAAPPIAALAPGAEPLDAEMLDGFAATLGVPVAVLAGLTGVPHPSADGREPAPAVADTAGLIREIRHLTWDQERGLTAYADELGTD